MNIVIFFKGEMYIQMYVHSESVVCRTVFTTGSVLFVSEKGSEYIMTMATKEMINQFLLWEKTSRDTIDFKVCYVDMADDLVAGLLLSQIVYWYLPSKNRSDAESKLRVQRDGMLWIAKGRTEWYDEIRLSPKQFDRASNLLVKQGLIEKKVMKFGEDTRVHIRLIWSNFLKRLNEVITVEPLEDMGFNLWGNPELTKGEIGNLPLGKSGIDERAIPSYTENTTENTTESVCPEEQEILSLLRNRQDIEPHTQKQLLSLLLAVKRKDNFQYSIFLETLNKVDFDIQDMNYFKRALTINLKEGYVHPIKKHPAAGSTRKEHIPADFDKPQPKESKPATAIQKQEIDELLKKLKEI